MLGQARPRRCRAARRRGSGPGGWASPQGQGFFLNEALLTGHSYPAEKHARDEGVETPEIASATLPSWAARYEWSASFWSVAPAYDPAGSLSSSLRRTPPPSAMDRGTDQLAC